MGKEKSLEDKVSDVIGMAPLHLTGLTAIPAFFSVLGDLLGGKAPDVKEAARAAGLLDVDGCDDLSSNDYFAITRNLTTSICPPTSLRN